MGSPQKLTHRLGPRKVLFDLRTGLGSLRGELREYGEFGIEARIFTNEQIACSRSFQPAAPGDATARERAVAWALAQRDAMA
jgi:hypothetical protein